jgi:molybdenum cofactor synthesis domain-containing protein
MEWNLLEKTTFWVEGAELEGANLGEVAAAAAYALNLEGGQVMVVDVQPGVVAFDVLKRNIPAESVAGKSREILEKLAAVQGVTLSSEASIHSEGILGLIALEPGAVPELLARSAKLAGTVAEAISKRVCIFATGSEVIAGSIEDTNSPFLSKVLTEAGFKAEYGGIIEDSTPAAANALEAALMRGFGLVLTTGGVGAESKDHSVEAVLKLDPGAHTPWILKFTPDMKRHHKEGVRIAVGRVGISRLIALPGPHEEVRAGCRALVDGLARGLDDAALAESIASSIRDRWLNHMGKEVKKHE